MKFILILLFLFISLNSNCAVLPEMQKELNMIAENSKRAVVSVQVIREEMARVIEPEFFFGYIIPSEKIYKYETGGIGSGFIIDERGYIVTNYHVVEGSDKIKIEMTDLKGNLKKVVGTFIGGDKNLDIAIIKVNTSEKFPYLKLNIQEPKVGDFAIAIGYPFGFKQTFTTGVISANKVSLKIEGRNYDSLIQTDAAINRGNSGGPLLNINGEVIGMNTAIYSPSGAFAGLGFAIPSWEITRVIDKVIYGKKMDRAWLGVYLLPTDEIIRNRFFVKIPEGAIINKVVKDSPAYKAGLKRGDIILSIDGDNIENNDDLISKMYLKKPEDEITISYVRDGKVKETKVKLSIMPDESYIAKLGEEYNTYQDSLGEEYLWKGVSVFFNGEGAYIQKIDINSPFAGYLQKGDLIKAIDNKKINSFQEMKKILNSANLSEGVLFDIERNGENMYVSVSIRE